MMSRPPSAHSRSPASHVSRNSSPASSSSPTQSKLWEIPFVIAFKLPEIDPSKAFGFAGDVQEVLDKHIGKRVYKISGAIPANNKLALPAGGRGSLDLHGQFIYIQLRIAPTKVFVFHIDLCGDDDMSYRFSFSNLYKAVKQTDQGVQFPCDSLGSKWSVFALNTSALFSKYFRKRSFKYLKSLEFCSTMLVRNVYTSDNMYTYSDLPRDMFLPVPSGTEWEEVYSWEWIPEAPSVTPTFPSGKIKEKDQSTHSNLTRATTISPLPPVSKRSIFEPSALPESDSGDTSSIHFDREVDRMLPDPIMKLEQIISFTGRVPGCVFWTIDGSQIVYPSEASVVVMDPISRDQRFIQGHTQPVCALSLCPRNQYLASAQEGKPPIIRLWNFATGRPIAIFDDYSSSVISLAFSSDTRYFCACGVADHGRQMISIWDISSCLKNGRIPSIVKGFSDFHISKIAFSPFEPLRLISVGRSSIRYWRVRDDRLRGCSVEWTFDTPIQDEIFTDIGFSIIGHRSPSKKIYVSSASGAMYRIDYDSRTVESKFQLHSGPIYSLAIREGLCATASGDGFVRVWPESFEDFFVEAQHEGEVSSVAVTMDGLRVAVGTTSGGVAILDVSSQKYKTILRSHTDRIADMTIDPHHREFATVSLDGTIRIWDMDTYEQLFQFDTVGHRACALAYHPTDYFIVAGFDNGLVRVFDIKTTSVLAEYEGHRNDIPVGKVQYTRDAHWILSIGLDGICICDALHDYQPVRILPVSTESHNTFALSGNGKYLAVLGGASPLGSSLSSRSARGGSFSEVLLYSTKDWTCLKSYALETSEAGSLLQVEFFGDDDVIVIDSYSRMTRFNLTSGSVISFVENIHDGRANCLTVSPNDKYILTGSSDAKLRVWLARKLSHGNKISKHDSQSFTGHFDEVGRLEFSRDGRTVISCSAGGAICVWRFLGDAMIDLSDAFDQSLSFALSSSTSNLEDDGPSGMKSNRNISVDESLPLKHFLRKEEFNSLAEIRYVPPEGESALRLRTVLGCNSLGHDTICWHPDSGFFCYACADAVVVEDLRSHEQIYLTSSHLPCALTVLRYCPVSGMVAGASSGVSTSHGKTGSPIVMWNVNKGVREHVLSYHEIGVQDMAFSPDGRFLVSIGVVGEKSLVIWDTTTGCAVASAETSSNPTHCVAWLPSPLSPLNESTSAPLPAGSDRELATCGRGGLTYWLLQNDRDLLKEDVHLPPPIAACEFTSLAIRDEDVLIAGTRNGYLTLFDNASNSFSCAVVVPNSSHDKSASEIDVLCVCGRRSIVAGSSDSTLVRFNGARVIRDPAISADASDAQLGSSYRVSSVASQRGTVRESPSSPSIPALGHPLVAMGGARIEYDSVSHIQLDSAITSAVFDSSGLEGMVGTSSGSIWYVNWQDSTSVRLVSGHVGRIRGITSLIDTRFQHISDEKHSIVSTFDDLGEIRVWGMSSPSTPFQQLATFSVSEETIQCISSFAETTASGHSSIFLAAGFDSGIVRVFDLANPESSCEFSVFDSQGVSAVAFSGENGELFVTGGTDGKVLLTSRSQGLQRRAFRFDDDGVVQNICTSMLSTNVFAVCHASGLVSVFSHANLGSRCQPVDTFRCVDIRLSLTRDPNVVREWRQHEKSMSSTAWRGLSSHSPTFAVFSPTEASHLFVSSSHLGTNVCIRDISSQRTLRFLDLEAIPRFIDVSPSGFLLAAGLADRLVRLADIEAGTFQDFEDCPTAVDCVQFSRDGKSLFCTSSNALYMWETLISC